MIQLQERREPSSFSLFNLGFRPFFLGGAIVAAVTMGIWLMIYSNGYQPNYYSYGIFWHAHEMLFGFSLAIIAGFLLTAVKNWTNVQTLFGWPLAALFCLWLLGRLLPLFEGLNPIAVAATDLAFTPLLIVAIAWPIIKSRNYRNLLFVPLLTGFFIANLLIHLQLLGITENTANSGIQFGLFLIVMIISVIGGRVIPFFTERGVNGVQCQRRAYIEKAVIPLTAAWVLLSLTPWETFIAIISLLLGLTNLFRLQGWFNLAIFRVPLVWILQLGYCFIGIGFILYGLSLLDLVSRSVALHAFAAGGIGSLTLGMMARVSLGHTGRKLEISPIIVAAFVLMMLSALVRVSIGFLPIPYLATLHLSGSLWILAWVLFLSRYISILIKPRVDGLYG